jgi:organic radical activating enzyme
VFIHGWRKVLINLSKVCALPFLHLATHPNGNVSLCCISDHKNCASHAKNDGKILTLNNSKVDDVLNSETFKTARLEMLQGIEPAACTRCYDEERVGIKSKRLEENGRYLSSVPAIVEKMEDDGRITEIDLEFIELRLGNICNLKCRTCNPISSSKWIKDYNKLQTELDFVTKYKVFEVDWYLNEDFWADLYDKSSKLKRIYVNGGEPTLMMHHLDYLDMLVASGLSQNIELWYNINLTSIPQRLFEILKNFKKSSITASIDDIQERNTYIRSGSNWEELLFNLSQLNDADWIDLSICQTISSYNIFYVKEFYEYFKEYKIHHNWCYDPDFLSPWNLPVAVKEQMIEKIQTMPDYVRNNITQTLRKDGDETKFRQFIAYNKRLDTYRNTLFSDVFPEFCKAINYEDI